MAPRAGFEPATNRLTAGCSTAELPGNSAHRVSEVAYSKRVSQLQRAKSLFSIFLRPGKTTASAGEAHTCRPGIVPRRYGRQCLRR